MVLVLLILTVVSVAQAPVPEPVTDQETELGQAMYKQLRDKGEIIEASPLYDSLKPIAEAIAREAQPRYPHPFKFFLVHETQPNSRLREATSTWWILFCILSRTRNNWLEPFVTRFPIQFIVTALP
jgi:hypothetical protein